MMVGTRKQPDLFDGGRRLLFDEAIDLLRRGAA